MSKRSSYISRFVLVMGIGLLIMSLTVFALSNYFFTQVAYRSLHHSLVNTMETGDMLLHAYKNGEMSLEEVRQKTDPFFNSSGDFLLLLDPDGKALAYTNNALPYFAANEADEFIEELINTHTSTTTTVDYQGKTSLMTGRICPDGIVLAGKTMSVAATAGHTFQQKLLIGILIILVLLIAAISCMVHRAARSAKMLTGAANQLIEGDQVLLPEDMHGELREIALAFNHMSRRVAASFQDLRLEKETMNLILESLNEGIYAIGSEGKILFNNQAAEKLLGGMDSEDTKAIHTALSDFLYAHNNRHPDETLASYCTGKIHQQDTVLEYVITLLPEVPGRPRGGAALIRDITQQEHLERTRHDYVANISHELRTPLASIKGLAEGLMDGLVTEQKDRDHYYTIIMEEATRLSRLVNDLLELSGLQSRPVAFEMEKIDSNELVWDLFDRNESLYKKANIGFDLSLPEEELPEIFSNEDRLTQVLTIFLDNARKYTPEGGHVTLGAKARKEGVFFYVRDNGIGMDENTRTHAFDRFHQAEISHSGKGSGLGLAIAKEVMDKLHLKIDLQSEPQKGSQFSFTVPFA